MNVNNLCSLKLNLCYCILFFQGKLSESWADVTKGAVAENILNLTKLPESSRSPQTCLASPTLWLALASLCVLDADHVERLSSGQWSAAEGQPTVPRVRIFHHVP